MKIQSKKLLNKIEQILKSEQLSGFRALPEYHLGGENVQLLEEHFRCYFDVKYAISLNSATAALHCALVACGVGQGDEVVVTPYSFVSSASCVLMAGAKPTFVDVEDKTFNMNSHNIVPTPQTKAVIPVHLTGHPADMDGIQKVVNDYYLWQYWKAYDKREDKKNIWYSGIEPIKIIEDAAQAIGAKWNNQFVGTLGDCGIFSFNQSKHINTGEGGMLITNNDKIAKIVRAMRNHAEVSCPDMKLLGYNYRMTEIEAVIALDQFERLEEDIGERIELCNYMTQRLGEIDGLTPPVVYPNCRHVYYTYGVKVDKNKIGMSKFELCERLGKEGVYFGNYVKPLYHLPIFGSQTNLCPVAERMYREELIVTDIFRPPMPLKRVGEIFNIIKGIIKNARNR